MSTRGFATAGWLMFALSGVFFLVPAIRNADFWSLGAAITWLIGVALFLLDGRSEE